MPDLVFSDGEGSDSEEESEEEKRNCHHRQPVLPQVLSAQDWERIPPLADSDDSDSDSEDELEVTSPPGRPNLSPPPADLSPPQTGGYQADNPPSSQSPMLVLSQSQEPVQVSGTSSQHVPLLSYTPFSPPSTGSQTISPPRPPLTITPPPTTPPAQQPSQGAAQSSQDNVHPSQNTSQPSQDWFPPSLNDIPSLEEVHRTFVTTCTWVPKAARGDFTRVFTSQCNRVAWNPDNTSVWILQLMFAKCILPAVKNRPDANNASAVRDRLSRWRKGEYRALWNEAVKLTKKVVRGKRRGQEQQQPSQEEKNAKRATRLAHQGEYTRAAQSLLSAGLAEHNPSTIRDMQAKHPPAAHPSQFQSEADNTPQLSFTKEQVSKAINSFRRGSAPGPDGLRAEHLKVAIKFAAPNRQDKAIDAITKIVNLMASGSVPDIVAPFISGAMLHAGLKKDGGIRPIAVGNLMRRLTSKCFMYGVADKAANLLGPHQLGVGVRGGLEAIIHSLRHVVTEQQDDNLMVLQLDFMNAFNCCDRDSAFRVVEEVFPECLKWVLTCYGSEAELIFGSTIIYSRTGFHQGDPLASLLFSLTLQPIVDKIMQQVPSLLLNEWYLDDGAAVGNKEELQRVVDIILEHGPARGLFLSTATTSPRPKSTVWSPNTTSAAVPTNLDPLERGVPLVVEEGIVLLGSPIGSMEFEKQTINLRVEKVRELTTRLPLMQDAHSEFVLLRSCLSIPKIMFTLRTTDPYPHQSQWKNFDSIVRETLTRILGSPVDDCQWNQSQMPVSKSGLGLRAALDHAPAAYISSILSSQDLKQQILNMTEEECPATISNDLLGYLSSKMGEEATTISLMGVSQSEISLKIDLNNLQLLTNHITELGSTRDIARLASLGLPHSGDFLNVVPSPALGLHLRPTEFIMSVKYRLGCDVFSTTGKCTACPHLSDAKGDHAISCGYEGERIARHNHLRDALHSACAQACLGPIKEGRFLLPGSDARPADVLIPHWTKGKDTALDITVVNPLQAALVNQAATIPGHALTYAHNRKMAQAGEECRREGLVFIPMAMETLGGWHDSTVSQVKKVGSALARQTGQEESEAIKHLAQRLSVLLAKANSALLLNRIPTFPNAETNGVE